MAGMFQNSVSFDQNLGSWNVSNVTGMVDFLKGVLLSPFNYNSLLSGWSTQALKQALVFNAGSSQYTSLANASRNTLTSTFGWTITDGGITAIGSSGAGFISTWQTANPGTSSNTQITLPLVSNGTYNFSVDWGDGSTNIITSYSDLNKTHTYASPGIYTVVITGTIVGWSFGGGGDVKKILNISHWQPLAFGATSAQFYGASNLSITATDSPSLAGTLSLQNAFSVCTALRYLPNANNWDVSSVTNMASTFSGSTYFNQDLSGWNTAAATNMSVMFANASAFNQDISAWNTAKVTTIAYMFSGATNFNRPLNTWNVGAVTDFSYVFNSASNFNRALNNWNTAAATDMAGMFQGASAFNQDISTWNTAKVTNMVAMFLGAINFNSPLNTWDLGSVTNFTNMFQYASTFNQPLNNWNTAAATSMYGMFQFAFVFNRDISAWNTAKVTSMNSMFTSAINFNSSSKYMERRSCY